MIDVRNMSVTRNGEKQRANKLIVTFAQATLPKEIKAGYLKIPVQQYYPSPLRCFKCQKFGHYKSVCKRAATCVLCGQAEHDASPCGGPPKYVNCIGNHSAFKKSCSDIGGVSTRALECLADSPPYLFVYSPLNAEDMDTLDVSD